LQELFDYVYTVKEPDYATYLGYGGLTIDSSFAITPMSNPDTLQQKIRLSWLGY
jgi:hypothetical protein